MSTPAVGGLVRRVGRRGAFLLFLFILDVVYAYGIANPTQRSAQNPTTLFIASVMPLRFWGLLWFLVSIACLVCAFRIRDAVGFAAAAFIKGLWALMFLLGWLFADVERGYLSTAIWGAFGLVVLLVSTWPEPRPALPHEAARPKPVDTGGA